MGALMYGTKYDSKNFRRAIGDAQDIASYTGTPADIDYLSKPRNDGVVADIKKGVYVNGYDHWLRYGKAESENVNYSDELRSQRTYNFYLNDVKSPTLANNKAKTIFIAVAIIGAAFILYKYRGKLKIK